MSPSLAPLPAQARKDLLSIQPQEAGLVLTRRVKDEVVEPELEVRPELLQVLVRVFRYKPAAMRHVLDGPGQPLHLARVVHAGLCLSWKGERCPDLRVFHGARTLRVVRHLDLDHAIEPAWIAT